MTISFYIVTTYFLAIKYKLEFYNHSEADFHFFCWIDMANHKTLPTVITYDPGLRVTVPVMDDVKSPVQTTWDYDYNMYFFYVTVAVNHRAL